MRSGFFSSRSRLSSRKVVAMAAEMLDQRRPPRIARRRIAERVELERHPAADAELGEQLVAHGDDLDVGRRLARADDLGVELVELAVAALLRPLVAEGGAVGRELDRRHAAASLRRDRRGRCRR